MRSQRGMGRRASRERSKGGWIWDRDTLRGRTIVRRVRGGVGREGEGKGGGGLSRGILKGIRDGRGADGVGGMGAFREGRGEGRARVQGWGERGGVYSDGCGVSRFFEEGRMGGWGF